jgi:hypothetical protein
MKPPRGDNSSVSHQGALVVDKWLIPSDSQVSLTIIYQVLGQKLELFLNYGILFPKKG